MQILQVCAYGAPAPGNFIATLLKLDEKLKTQGIETIYAFVERAKDIEWCKELQKKSKVYFLPEAKARILPETYKRMKNIFDENDIGIVHSHFELYDIPVCVTAPKNVKVFRHLHDAIKHGYETGSFSRRTLTKLQYSLFGQNSTLLSVSEEHLKFVLSLGFKKSNAIYFPNGIDTDRIATDKKAADNKEMLMFGWDYYRKGVDLAVEALQLLQPTEININVVGEEVCRNKLAEKEHPGITFREKCSDVNSLYADSKAFVHISRAEGLSYALLEAIYFGLPIICSDIPENMFAKVFNGVCFTKNEDVKNIADTIKTVSELPGLTDEQINQNREIIQQQYSVECWCNKLIDLYLA